MSIAPIRNTSQTIGYTAAGALQQTGRTTVRHQTTGKPRASSPPPNQPLGTGNSLG